MKYGYKLLRHLLEAWLCDILSETKVRTSKDEKADLLP